MRKHGVMPGMEERTTVETIEQKGSHRHQNVLGVLVSLNRNGGKPLQNQQIRIGDMVSALRISMLLHLFANPAMELRSIDSLPGMTL